MKLLVDRPLSPEIARWLRSLGHDAAHADDLSIQSGAEFDLLQVAAAEGRVVITAGYEFERLIEAWGRTRAKFILLRSEDYSEAESREAVSCGLAAIDKAEFAPSIVVVGRGAARKAIGQE